MGSIKNDWHRGTDFPINDCVQKLCCSTGTDEQLNDEVFSANYHKMKIDCLKQNRL